MIKNVLFTHNDLDGAGCKIIFDLAMYNTNHIAFFCANNGPKGINEKVKIAIEDGTIDDNTKVYIADICPSVEMIERLKAVTKNISIFDHHETAMYANNIEGINANIISHNALGSQECGTSLIYKYFMDKTIPGLFNDFFTCNSYCYKFLAELVDCIRSYDTYEWKKTNNQNAKRLQTLWQLLKMERFCDHYVQRIYEMEVNKPRIIGDLIIPDYNPFIDAKLEYAQEVIDNFSLDDCYIIDVKGYKVALVVKATMANISELSYQFLVKNPDIDIMALFSLYDGGTFSFRTIRNDINLGRDIAEPLNGGGHPKAAGATVPTNILHRLYDSLFYWLNGITDRD